MWTPLERALVTAVDEMIDDHAVGDATWAALASHFEPAEMFELLFVVGGYLCLAAVLNSIGLQAGLPTPEADRGGAEGEAMIIAVAVYDTGEAEPAREASAPSPPSS